LRPALLAPLSVAILSAACATAATTGFEDARDAGADGASLDLDATAPPREDAGAPDDATLTDAPRDARASEGGARDAGPDVATCPTPCGYAQQCGCTATGTCDVVAPDGGVGCVPAGTFGAGGGCTTTSACAPGLVCAYATCHVACAVRDAGCAGGGTCVPGALSGNPPRNYLVCETPCELVSPTACGVGAAGIANVCIQDDTTGGTDCIGVSPANVAAAGGACGANKLCPSGSVCTVPAVSDGGNGVCRRWCRAGQNDCTGCVAFTPAVVVRGFTYGYCP